MPGTNEERDTEIYRLAMQDTPYHVIAEQFGVSRQRVGQVFADMTPAAFGFTDKDRAQVRARETAVLEMLARYYSHGFTL